MNAPRHHQIFTHLGVRTGFAEFGRRDGAPVFYCHGFPASRLEGCIFENSAIRNNVRLIVIDRPGYGLSDPKRLTKVAHWPGELIELADHLNIDRFAVLGVSGGGPYALACASRFPARLLGVGVVCSLGPVYKKHLLAAMNWSARPGFLLASSAPRLLPIFFGDFTARLMRWRPGICQSLLTTAAPAADIKVLKNPEVALKISDSLKEGLRQGAKGPIADFHRYVNHWGFELGSIGIEVQLWHGQTDALVPPSHTAYVENHLPKTRCEFVADEGHFSLPILHADTIFQRLLAKADS